MQFKIIQPFKLKYAKAFIVLSTQTEKKNSNIVIPHIATHILIWICYL